MDLFWGVLFILSWQFFSNNSLCLKDQFLTVVMTGHGSHAHAACSVSNFRKHI